MRIPRRLTMSVAAAVLAVGFSGLAVRIYMGRESEDRLAASEAVSIAQLRSPLPRAAFLSCPAGYCSAAEAITSPVFDAPWERLRNYWAEVISGEKRMTPVQADPDLRRYVYIQHSPTFRFPDILTVEFVSLSPHHSSIAVYSRSRYGEYDFGKNRKRVEKLLVLLQRIAQPAAPRQGRADNGG